VVLHASGRREVYAGAALVGQFEPGDVAMRNLLLVTVAGNDGTVVFEDLARAFGVTSETVRVVRREYEARGLLAVVTRKATKRRPSKVTLAVRKQVMRLFDEGLTQTQARAKLKKTLSKGTLNTLHQEWREARRLAEAAAKEAPVQTELSLKPEAPVPESVPPTPEPAATVTADESTERPTPSAPTESATTAAEPVVTGALAAKKEESGYVLRAPEAASLDDGRTLPVAGPTSKRRVQFLGAWLLVAMTARLGLHAAVASESAKQGAGKALRLAVDAVTVALGIGEACVEGVRRLAHQSAAALLLSARAPSPTWVRGVLSAAAAKGRGFFIRAKLSGSLMRDAAGRAGELAVFYVDNHLRPYTGLRRLLFGWRMQDKRAMPGTTDFHVHDADGRPLYRVATLAHDSLGKLLLPIAALLKLALGEGQRYLLAFDRAASYAEVMAELRDAKFDFVAYEKKPYRPLAKRCFRDEFVLDGERLRWCETRKNLGQGRGRIRRVCVLLPDGHQVNLLAHSTAPAPALIAIMAGRWNQENAFKHAVERWGLNQLDGRTFEPFDADFVIPSPARRRLDASLAVLREAEGQLHRKLLRVTRFEDLAEFEEELARNLERQRVLEAKRADLPTHCTVEEAGLHGELMHQQDEYKAVIDTIRTACINAEADLAAELAPAMARPREAKRLLRNLFSAPGDLRVTATSIEVVLDVAATKDEQSALEALCRAVNARKLTHPGDSAARPLRFRTQVP
jgi:transposase-like protein